MDGSHPDSDPVPNTHIVKIDWLRTSLDGILPFGEGFEAELFAPYDVKRERVRYELPDGTPFDNPEGDLHHRNETLEGPGDLELIAHYRTGGWRFSAGWSIPTGKTEPNPYVLGDLGLKHEHIQFGSGTFDPLLRVAYLAELGPAEFNVAIGTRLPFYDNPHGYQAARVLDVMAGPIVKVADGLSFTLSYTASYQTRAHWDGE